MKAKLDETRSDHGPGQRLEEAILAFLECRERGEEPDLRDWLLHNPEARAALNELVEDEKALEPWFGPLRAVTLSVGVGRFFGNYELLEKVGKGGQGVIYRARQIHINKEYALKLVNPHDRLRSLRELEMAACLEHENLVRVYHVGEQEGRLYFTMKLAEKGSLDMHLAEYGLSAAPVATVTERQAVEQRKKQIACFLAKIARAVHYMHEQGIIHRDLKLRNILVDAKGEPLVIDLGLARRIDNAAREQHVAAHSACRQRDEDPSNTGEGKIVGTSGYMALEQAQGRTDLTPAVDIYGLGAILYKLLTNRTPFVGETKEEINAQTADPERLAPPPSLHNPNVGIGSDLDLICRKCLVKQPSGRYPNAADLAEDLECFVRDEPISLRREGPLERIMRAVVEAINKKLPIRSMAITRWGAIDLWDAGLNLALGVTLYTMIRTDQPPALLWVALLTFIVVWWWMFLTYLFRHKPLEQAERNLALLWGGVTLASVTLFWLYCPPFGPGRAADLLAYYPPWTVVNGLAFLVVGRLYWGRYYLLGLAHFLVAILMPLRLDLAPLVYGVFVAVCMACGAWDHYRTAQRAKPSSEARKGR